jgi:GntR family transcriptional regulator, rspAB operon transcriptional repressor
MSANDTLPDFALPVLDLEQPTAHQIHAALRSAILSLALTPGTRLSEAETGARFGASRTPVREAMTSLRDEGLIVTWPSRGNFVTRISEDVVRNAQFIRQALETAALARICATGLDPEDHARMEATLEAQDAAIAAGDTAAFHAADDAFHAALAGATGLSRVRKLVMREKAALDRLRALRLGDTEHLRLLEDEHRRILNAMHRGRSERAARVLERHLTRVLDVLEDLKAAHGDYFE